MPAESMSLICSPQKKSCYAYFTSQNMQSKALNMLNDRYTISHSLLIFATIFGWVEGQGRRDDYTAKSRHVYLLIVDLTDI
jgi:hypothetical protein